MAFIITYFKIFSNIFSKLIKNEILLKHEFLITYLTKNKEIKIKSYL